MIKLKTEYTINCEDIKELTGKHWSDFEFAQMAENDSYQILPLSDWYVEDLAADIEDELRSEGENLADDYDDYEAYRRSHSRLTRLKNQYELVNILRKDYGLREQVLIFVSW